MQRLRVITRAPLAAQTGQGDKYPFFEDLLLILIPLYTHKDPQNPVPGTTGGTGAL